MFARITSTQTLQLISAIIVATVVSFGAIYSLIWLSELARSTFLNYQWLVVFSPLVYTFIIFGVRTYAPPVSSSGIPQVLAVKNSTSSAMPKAVLSFSFTFIKILLISSATLFGAPLGIGGPSIYIGAALFYSSAKLMRIKSQIALYSFIVIGSGSGIMIVFNAPLAGVSFALEEIYRNSKKHNITIILLAIAFIAGIDYSINSTPYFLAIQSTIPNILQDNWWALPLLVIASSMLGALFVKGSLYCIKALLKCSITRLIFTVFGLGILIALLNYFSDGIASGGGKDEALRMLQGEHLGIEFLLYKLSIVFSSLISTIPGGIFVPSITIGASIGDVMSHIMSTEREWVILLAMTSYLSAISRTPFTAALIITEITTSYTLLPLAMLVALASNVIAKRIEPRPLYYELAKQLTK